MDHNNIYKVVNDFNFPTVNSIISHRECIHCKISPTVSDITRQNINVDLTVLLRY